MANKNILQLNDIEEKLSLSDYFIIWDKEENAVEPTKKVTLAELIDIFSAITSVNGKTDKEIILKTDDISSAGQTNKYLSQAEKVKLSKLKTDQPSNTYLDGSGNYTNIPVVDNLESTDPYTGLSANQGKVLKELNDSLAVLINNITANTPTTGDSLLKLFNLISSNSDLIQDIFLTLNSDKETLNTFQELVDFIENNRDDLDNYVLALEGKANKATGDAEIDHTTTITTLPSWISSIYTAGKAKLRAVLDKLITEIELVKLAYMPLLTENLLEMSSGGYVFESSGDFILRSTAAPIELDSVSGLRFNNEFGTQDFTSGSGFNFINTGGNQQFTSEYGFSFSNPNGSFNIDSKNGVFVDISSGSTVFNSKYGFYVNNPDAGSQNFDSLHGFYFLSSEGDINIDVKKVLYSGEKEITDNNELTHKKYVDDKVAEINTSASDISGVTSIDLANLDVLRLTLQGDVTAFDVLNPVVGKTYKVYMIQDTVGGRTLSGLDPKFKTENNIPILLSTDPGSMDLLQLDVFATDNIKIYPIYNI